MGDAFIDKSQPLRQRRKRGGGARREKAKIRSRTARAPKSGWCCIDRLPDGKRGKGHNARKKEQGERGGYYICWAFSFSLSLKKQNATRPLFSPPPDAGRRLLLGKNEEEGDWMVKNEEEGDWMAKKEEEGDWMVKNEEKGDWTMIEWKEETITSLSVCLSTWEIVFPSQCFQTLSQLGLGLGLGLGLELGLGLGLGLGLELGLGLGLGLVYICSLV